MGTVSAEELSQLDSPAAETAIESIAGEDGVAAGKERIRVSVRLRPLNEDELARNDPSDWECINKTTIAFRNSLFDRSMPPTAYTFDRVFCCESNTRQVYEGGAKEVAMSVVSGINASIFAYGQTSSGKTYTMTGITEMAASDIYDYIERHKEREFVLKFSAMEIYNESVRDLLGTDNTPLRLLDGPGRSTIVEKLTEEVVKDWEHIMQLLSICEAQREIGETTLNKTSSRSHQIIRLTIESSAREFVSVESSRGLTASVHFVDLAGSERASQAMSAGARLKEGCHINRSLLTLGTVIRKLSKDHIGHIPYRDSKLTRILQQSLGGNARTAIICTMSPARSHIEQSRNTLLFAMCAKEVVTSAQVNVVMSDKALVKHLQRELARLESQLRLPRPVSVNNNVDELLREREDRIQQMEIDIREITRQRDVARAQLDDLLRTAGDDQESIHQFGVFRASASDLPSVDGDDYSVDNSFDVLHSFENSSSNYGKNCRRSPENSTGHYSVDNSFDVLHSVENSSSKYGTDFRRSPEISTGHYSVDNSFDVLHSVENSSSKYGTNFRRSPEISTGHYSASRRDSAGSVSSERREFLSLDGRPETEELCKEVQCVAVDDTITGMRQLEVRKGRREWELLERGGGSYSSTSWQLGRSRSCRAAFMASSPCSWFQEEENNESTPPGSGFLVESRRSSRPEDIRRRLFSLSFGVDGEAPFPSTACTSAADQSPPRRAETDDAQEADEKRSSSETGKSMKDAGVDPIMMSPSGLLERWPEEFERRRLEIIELWHLCNVSIIHRTFFFLLCLGDPGDSIYLELEFRRLSFIKRALAGGNGTKISPSSNAKALRRERGMLCRQMQRRLSAEERETLYRQWGIPLQTKQRKLQLAHLVWTAAGSVFHATESAAVVAKVVGQPTEAHKEMLILSFSLTHNKKMKVNL